MKSEYIKLLFLGIILVLLTTSLLTYRNLRNYTDEVKSIRQSSDVLTTLEMVLSNIKDAETSHRGYQLTLDTTYLGLYYNSLETLPAKIRLLDSLTRYNVRQTLKVDSIQTLTNNQVLIISKILTNASRKTLYMDRYESALLLDAKMNMDRIREVAGRIRRAEELLVEEKISTETGIRNIAPIALLAYGLVALAGMSMLFVRVLRELEKTGVAERSLKQSVAVLKQEVSVREFTQKTLQNVLDTSLDGIMAFKSVRDKTDNIIDFVWTLTNPVSVKLTGQAESMVGKHLLHVLPQYDREGLFDAFKNVVKKKVPQQFEKHFNSDGADYWYQVSAAPLDDGLMVTFSDITSQKLQRLLVEERELLLKEAEKVAHMGSWKWSQDTDELIWSDGLHLILRTEQTAGRPEWDSFLENVCAEDQPPMMEFLKNVQNSDGLRLDYRITLDNTIHYMSIVSRQTRVQQSSFPGVLGTVIDITERKLYENQLKQYTSELQRSNKDLEQFAYVASHDLQEPLRKIRAFGDRLETKYGQQLAGGGLDYIRRMQSAAERMQSLIEDLLSFSRVSRNETTYEWLDTTDLIDEVIDDLEVQIKREAATIHVGNLPKVRGDKTQVKRLFQNLISNAIKFRMEGRKPIIEVNGAIVDASGLEGDFGVKLPSSRYIRLAVKDNGIGFDEKYKEKMFTIFQRLQGRSQYEGTGIGLSICRKIVLNHKGLITAKSIIDEGSEFIIIFPIE
jgi:signal transduction histidine kinase/CHASE3 domain sensor protein